MKKCLVICILLVGISCYGQATKPFTFVQLCDIQLGMGGYDHDVKSFRQAVKQINALHPDFAVICGDLVNTPNDSSYADFKKIMKGFSMPCYCIPGNHDVGNIPDNASLKYYRTTIGKDYYSFTRNGYSFIAINTQLWKVNVENESHKFDAWFNETLRSFGNKHLPIIVLGHIPMYRTDPEEKEVYSNLPQDKREEVLELLKQNNVLLYLSGHSHTLIINNYKGIQLVSGETTSKNFDKRPLGFRLWKVSSDSIRHQFIQLETNFDE